MKRLTSFASVRTGDRFTVISNTNSHCYPLNVPLVFKRDGALTDQMSDMAVGGSYNTIHCRDIVLLNKNLTTLEKELAETQVESDALKSQIKFCRDHGLDEYDEELHTVHDILSKTKANRGGIEKSKAVLDMLRENLIDR